MTADDGMDTTDPQITLVAVDDLASRICAKLQGTSFGEGGEFDAAHLRSVIAECQPELIAFCDCRECGRLRAIVAESREDVSVLKNYHIPITMSAIAVIKAWEQTGYSPGLMTEALKDLETALGKK